MPDKTYYPMSLKAVSSLQSKKGTLIAPPLG